MSLTKKLLVSIAMTFSCSALACKKIPDPAYFNPEIAETIMLVQVENSRKDNSIFFNAKPLWKKQRFEVSSGECVGYSGYETGELLLFYSSLSEKKLKSKIVTARDGVGVSFNRYPDAIKDSLAWLTKRQEIPKGHPNVFWGYCQKDEECTQTKNSCDELVGVSKRYKASYDGYIVNNKFPKKCPEKKKVVSVSKCVEHFCS